MNEPFVELFEVLIIEVKRSFEYACQTTCRSERLQQAKFSHECGVIS